MSLSAREQEALSRIAEEIASSDSNLAALLNTFTRLNAGEEMPEAREVRRVRRSARRAPERRSPPDPLLSRPVSKAAWPHVAWLPAVVILMVTVLIVVTAALSGAGKQSSCSQMRGLQCVSQMTANPSAQRPG